MPIPFAALAAIFGPTLLNLLFKDESGRRLLELVSTQTDPRIILERARQLYLGSQTGPAMTSARANLGSAANAAQAGIAASLAERGLTSSGIGAIATGASKSLYTSGLAGLESDLWRDALERATRLSEITLRGAAGIQAPRDIGKESFAALLDALGKLKFTSSKTESGGAQSLIPTGRQAPAQYGYDYPNYPSFAMLNPLVASLRPLIGRGY